MIKPLPLYKYIKNFNNDTNFEKQEMNYLNYSNALWDCFRFHIAQVGNMLSNLTILPEWAIGPGWLYVFGGFLQNTVKKQTQTKTKKR